MAQGRVARIAGPQGPVISQLGYGAMGFHAFYTTTMPKQEDVEEVFNELVKTHPNPVMLDTASLYTFTPGNGDNERSIGAWLKRYPEQREKIFLASKYLSAPDGSLLSTAQDAIDSCNASLERLGLSSVDLYYIHRPNRESGISGAMHGLKSLKEEGKIKYVGVSEFNLAELKEANEIVHVDAYQIEVSPWTPEIMQNGLLDWCTQNGTSVVAYSPLGRGALANRWQSYDEIPEGDWRRNNERFMGENWDKNMKLVQDIVDIGKKKGHGVTPSQVTLAWLMAISDNIFPIPGTTSMQRLRENAGAASLQLSKDEVDSITQLVNSFTVSGDRYTGAFAKLSAF